jgi:hypothetical protein
MPTNDRKLHEGDRRAEVVTATVVDSPRGGRMARNPGHKFQPAIARKVEILAAIGNSQEVIAFACDIHVDTLRKYYREELDKAHLNTNARVGAAILNSALGERADCTECKGTGGTGAAACEACGGTGEGKAWVREPNTTAQVWWSKNRMGWTDRERIEHVGDGGGPIITEQRSSADTIKSRLAAIEKRLNPPANDKAA